MSPLVTAIASALLVALQPGTGPPGEGYASLAGFRLAEGAPCISSGALLKDVGARDFFGEPIRAGESLSIGPNQAHGK